MTVTAGVCAGSCISDFGAKQAMHCKFFMFMSRPDRLCCQNLKIRKTHYLQHKIFIFCWLNRHCCSNFNSVWSTLRWWMTMVMLDNLIDCCRAIIPAFPHCQMWFQKHPKLRNQTFVSLVSLTQDLNNSYRHLLGQRKCQWASCAWRLYWILHWMVFQLLCRMRT